MYIIITGLFLVFIPAVEKGWVSREKCLNIPDICSIRACITHVA